MRITVVRCDEGRGRELLRNYIFGGFRAGPRPPRGVEPKLVSQFIKDELKPDSSPSAYAKTVSVLRFYERSDVVEHIRKALTGREQTRDDIKRSAYALQAIGEVGMREDIDKAAVYLDEKLVPCPEVLNNLPLMFETLVVLAPSGSLDKLSKRIDEEVRRREITQNENQVSRMAYHEIAAIQRNHLPRAVMFAQRKKELLEIAPADRCSELIRIYLGTSSLSDNLMITWAGRMLRREAMEDDPGPIYAAFASEIAKADPKKIGEDAMTDTIVNRAAQAIIYLQGKLARPHRELYEKTKLGAMNFLWDDL